MIDFLKQFVAFLVAIFVMSVAIDMMLYWSKQSFSEVLTNNLNSIGFKIIAALVVAGYISYQDHKKVKK